MEELLSAFDNLVGEMYDIYFDIQREDATDEQILSLVKQSQLRLGNK